MAVSDWSTTAASNNAAPPNGAPEGQTPSSLNNCIREVMASVRAFYDNAALKDAVNTFTAATQEIENATPKLLIDETDAAADERSWLIRSSAGVWALSTATDAAPTVAIANAITADRTGTVVDSLNFQATMVTTTGNRTLTGAEFLTGVISPSALATGNTNDYAPTGFASARIVRLTTDAAGSTLTGIAGGAANRVVTLINIGTALLTLKAESASSTAANRFGLGADAAISSGLGCTLVYDGTSSRWRVVF